VTPVRLLLCARQEGVLNVLSKLAAQRRPGVEIGTVCCRRLPAALAGLALFLVFPIPLNAQQQCRFNSDCGCPESVCDGVGSGQCVDGDGTRYTWESLGVRYS
jgi:hypothetical protein